MSSYWQALRIGSAIALIGLTAVSGHFAFSNRANAQRGGPGWRHHDFWQPGWMRHHRWGRRHRNPEMRARMQRHWTFMHEGLPRQYENARSNVKPTPAVIAAGAKLYADNCASCHGKTGLGDGEAGKSLTPSPALLAYLIQRPIAVDSYLLWSVSEGGKEFGTAMPAFKDVLARDDIWKVIAYMRAGFPETKTTKK